MAQKEVVLDIKLTGTQSIGELEKDLAEVNKQLKEVPVNSKAFGELAAKSQELTASLKDAKDAAAGVSKEVKQVGINAAQIAEGGIKLTKGIAGGFELAAQAASAFGEENAEAYEKSIKRATEYVAQANALKDLAEGFGQVSVKGLKDTVTGFLNAGKGAKIFGIALTSTGVGAIVVGLGFAVAALAANWESVVGWVEEFVDSIPWIKSIVDTVKELGGVLNIVKASFAAVVGFFNTSKSAAEEFDKAIAEGKALNALEEQEAAMKLVNEERERAIKLLEAEGKKEQDVFAIKKKIQQETIDSLNERKRITGELSKEEKKQLADAINNLKILEAQEKNFENKKREEAAKTAEQKKAERKKEAEDAKKAADEEIAFNKKVNDDIRLRKIQLINDEEKRLIETAEFKRDLEKQRLKADFDANKISLEQLITLYTISREELNKEIEKIEEDARKKRVQKDIDQETKNINEKIDLIKKYYSNIEKLRGGFLDMGTEEVFSGGVKVGERAIERFVKSLGLTESIKEINESLTKLQSDALSPEGLLEYQKYSKQLNDTIAELNKEYIKSGFQLKEVTDQLNKYYDLVGLTGKELAEINFAEFYNKKNLEEGFDSALELEKDYLKATRKERRQNNDESIEEYREYLRVLREETGESRIGISEEWREGLEEGFAYLQKAAEGANYLFEFFIEQESRKLEGLKAELEAVDALYDESVNRRSALEEELKEAEGARYQEILNSIAKEKVEQKRLADEKLRIANAEIKVNNEIAKQKWQQAVLQSAILTAGAILNALNTVPPASFAFAAVTAALAGLQTAIVIANKPQDKPLIKAASGGYTPAGVGAPDETGERPVGIVHEKEWVAPRWMVESDRYGSIIGQLEGARKTGFAQGGFTTTPVIADNTGSGTQALMAALQGLNLQVAVTEINEVQSRVSVIEERASV